MADQDSAARRQRKLASYHRRVAERRERGLCIKCGKRPPAPDRSICASCGEKARAAERARAERLRVEGKPVRDPETRRQADRERDRRQHAERKAAGLCVKCGQAPALPERTQCGPCAERRLAADRARHAGRGRRASPGAIPKPRASPTASAAVAVVPNAERPGSASAAAMSRPRKAGRCASPAATTGGPPSARAGPNVRPPASARTARRP